MICVSFDNCPGFLHEADGDIGVILCSAQGFEELCARKDWRLLAEDIAAAGLPVLRFDYAGTGDAAGSDFDSGRVDAWLTSLRSAIAFMRERAGARRIVLLGLRLGAALAAMAARDDADIAGFAALHPAVSGKAYARELAVMSRVIAQTPGAERIAGVTEVAGFVTGAETMAAIKAIDLAASPRAPAAEILICAPPEAPGADALAARWRALGSAVTQADFPHYAEWMSDPTTSRRPAEAMALVKDWIVSVIVPHAGKRAARPGLFAAPRVADEGYAETPVFFGPDKNLFGVLCEPMRPAPGAAAVILTNAGRNYHIGWARMAVTMARALAAKGHASFRIDVAGLGDSPDIAGRDPQVMYCAEPIRDLCAAIDELQARGADKICVAGLCSGAHLAFHTALADVRVRGLVMINLQRFIWKPGYSLEIAMRESCRSTDFYKRSILKPETWKRLLRGEIRLAGIGAQMASRLCGMVLARAADALGRGESESAAVRAGLSGLAGRGVKILLVYSDNDGGIDELARHLGAGGKGLAAYRGARLEILRGGDHNLTPYSARARAGELIAAFAADLPPAAAPEREPAAA